ncbi:MAG: lactate utilization protein [Bacteroidetes bacterium]|nr:lactate utilization protein [Bacteroidota bacterium]MCL5025643.1 lactate utilization protein [Chloroflexota bacterium]
MDLERLNPDERARVERTFTALEQRGVHAIFVPNRQEALRSVLQMMPAGAAVAHGSSTTLEQIGLVAHLDSPSSPYRYANAQWRAENDAEQRGRLRARLSLEADYYLGSVQAICETGEVIGCDATGSRQAFYIYGPTRVIWVAGLNKLVPAVADGLRRAREVALPLEDQRVKRTGGSGSYIGKMVIYERERPGRITLVLVGEELGF